MVVLRVLDPTNVAPRAVKAGATLALTAAAARLTSLRTTRLGIARTTLCLGIGTLLASPTTLGH